MNDVRRHLERIRQRKQAENERLIEFRRKKAKSSKELLEVAEAGAGSEAAARRMKFYKKVFSKEPAAAAVGRKRPRSDMATADTEGTSGNESKSHKDGDVREDAGNPDRKRGRAEHGAGKGKRGPHSMFDKEKRAYEEGKDSREQDHEDYIRRYEERAKKQHARKRLSKQMQKRTKRGQPLMGVRVKSLLDRIQSRDSELVDKFSERHAASGAASAQAVAKKRHSKKGPRGRGRHHPTGGR